jgi:DNA-binding HxlR family transcriptional regulator
MGFDRTESSERGIQHRRKPGNTHPIAAIEKRVLDSEAYADLTFAARAALIELAKALPKGGNGHVFIARAKWAAAGFSSKTVTRALAELVSHGIIYKTKSGGIGRGCSTYALTWLPITKKDGLYLQGFTACAWRNWQKDPKKNARDKFTHIAVENIPLTPE